MDSINILEKTNYDDILIVFSARKTDKGKFTFYKQVIDFPATIIFVNDYATEWYLHGTPEFNDSLDLSNYLLGEIYRLKRKRTKVFTLGSSMGAYAALFYGSLLQVDKILAFGPESELCIPLGRSVESLGDKYKEGYADISRLHYKSPQDVLIISGNNDIPDLYCTSKFREGNPRIEIKLINNYTHVVAKYIHDKIPLSEFLLEYFTSSVEEIFEMFEFAHVLPVNHALSMKLFNEELMINKKVLLSEKKNIFEISNLHINWSMPAYYAGLINEKEGDLDNAIKYLKRALSMQNNLGRARLRLAQIYLRQLMLEDALDEALFLKENNFTYGIGMLLVNIYQKNNDKKLFKSILKEMLESIVLTKEQKKNINIKLNIGK